MAHSLRLGSGQVLRFELAARHCAGSTTGGREPHHLTRGRIWDFRSCGEKQIVMARRGVPASGPPRHARVRARMNCLRPDYTAKAGSFISPGEAVAASRNWRADNWVARVRGP